ncbi:hypothetical protein FGO68_gene13248 [Halteria grandinella]|uniref:Uncharacterized protein n=1 Tax=Halteria grandinella TaxID=5974 RepID=A0A8J8SV93_HALGN|nr:hypothetical protein FGO68_gene13248 [Halteria grandinella]
MQNNVILSIIVAALQGHQVVYELLRVLNHLLCPLAKHRDCLHRYIRIKAILKSDIHQVVEYLIIIRDRLRLLLLAGALVVQHCRILTHLQSLPQHLFLIIGIFRHLFVVLIVHNGWQLLD